MRPLENMPENISKKQAAALKLAQDAKENFEVKATMEGLLDTVEESVRKETIVLTDDIDHERPPSRSMPGMPPFSSALASSSGHIVDDTGGSDPAYEPTSSDESSTSDDDYSNAAPVEVSSIDPDDLQVTDQNVENQMPYIPRPLKRRRIAEPEAWKRNKQRKARLLNQPYNSLHSGKAINPKDMISPGCNCKKHCSESIPHQKQRQIFNYYWSLETEQAKRDYLVRRMKREKPARKLTKSKSDKPKPKNWTFKYYFNDGEKEIEVCQKFFRCTFGFPSDSQIRVAQKVLNEQGTATPKEPRGPPVNKLSEQDVQHIRDHINSFPKMLSHFCRANSSVLYLNSALNYKIMHGMYKIWLVEQNLQDIVKYPSYIKYKEIFKTMNLRFHRNKKDKCKICVKSEKISGNVLQKTKYDNEILQPHLERKMAAIAEKLTDTTLSKSDESIHVVTMDLQAILPCPVSKSSLTFYKRHLRCYNFTIYAMAEKRGYCYSWSELNGGKGTNEIASALYHYLQNYVPTAVKRVILWSDGCGGQNRNSILSSALLRFVQSNNTMIEIIDQKYLEVGHTQMEVDTMHANIQNYRRRRNREIEISHDWEKVFSEAVGGAGANPYVVTKLGNLIFDYKPIADLLNFPKKFKDFTWRNIKHLQYKKGEPGHIYYRNNFNNVFSSIEVYKGHSRVGRRPQENYFEVMLQRAYNGQIPICSKKKKDLLDLIKDGVIDECHTLFYSELIAEDEKREEEIIDQMELQENELRTLELCNA